MACLNPSVIKNRRFDGKDREFIHNYSRAFFPNESTWYDSRDGSPPYLIPPDYYIKIPCGTCFACLKRRRSEWVIRLMHEVRQHKESVFFTLTFDEHYLDKFKDDYKVPFKLYIDRLRKALGYRPRYFAVTELGDAEHHTGRLHFHGIFFGTSQESFSFIDMHDKWPYGNVWCGYVNFKTIGYLTKYMLKFQSDYKPIMMLSNGIGKSYLDNLDKVKRWHLRRGYRPFIEYNGRYYPLPMYYKLKMFNETERYYLYLDNYHNPKPFEQTLNGETYTDEYTYWKVSQDWYKETLRLGLSKQPKLHLASILTTVNND